MGIPLATSGEDGLEKILPELILVSFDIITLAFRSKTVGESYCVLSWRYFSFPFLIKINFKERNKDEK